MEILNQFSTRIDNMIIVFRMSLLNTVRISSYSVTLEVHSDHHRTLRISTFKCTDYFQHSKNQYKILSILQLTLVEVVWSSCAAGIYNKNKFIKQWVACNWKYGEVFAVQWTCCVVCNRHTFRSDSAGSVLSTIYPFVLCGLLRL